MKIFPVLRHVRQKALEVLEYAPEKSVFCTLRLLIPKTWVQGSSSHIINTISSLYLKRMLTWKVWMKASWPPARHKSI